MTCDARSLLAVHRAAVRASSRTFKPGCSLGPQVSCCQEVIIMIIVQQNHQRQKLRISCKRELQNHLFLLLKWLMITPSTSFSELSPKWSLLVKRNYSHFQNVCGDCLLSNCTRSDECIYIRLIINMTSAVEVDKYEKSLERFIFTCWVICLFTKLIHLATIH